MAEDEAPKIIVDSDWKSEAQAEKARLAEEEKKKAEEVGEGGAEGPGQRGMPPADFKTLLGTMVQSALLYMGAFPDPDGRAMVSLEHAKLHIDLLGVLHEKTKGNLSEEEEHELSNVLNELRLQFVEVTKAVAKAVEQQNAPGGPGAPGPGGIPGVGGVGGGISGPQV